MKRKRSTQPSGPAKKAAGPYRQQQIQRQDAVYGRLLLARAGEKKNIDSGAVTGTIVAAQATASLLLINGVDDGATSTTRVGRRITMTSLEIRWLGSLAATSAGSSPLRMTVVYDKQSNGAAPAVTDVFAADVISTMMNLSNSRRFKVLVDEEIECVGLNGPSAWNSKIWRDFTAKGTKPGLEVEFNDNSTATITSIQTGSVYAFFWQNGNIITANPTSQFFSRVRFTDL